jgi:hypothetical protein
MVEGLGTMNIDEIIGVVLNEVVRAEKLHPYWPQDPIHAAGIVVEEAGELMQACIDNVYKPVDNMDSIKREAVQTAAMGIRFLINIHKLERDTI